MSNHTLSTVDPAVVTELRGIASGQGDLYARLVDLFCVGSSGALGQVRTALESEALDRARWVCHRLKSSAANVGAMGFAQAVAELERLCMEGDQARGWEVLGELEEAHPTLLVALTHA